jgi:hypothetical protein
MTGDELRSYQGLKKEGAILLKSQNKRYLVVVSTKLRNFWVTLPIRIPVTTAEYQNPRSYIPQYHKGPDTKREQERFCVENSVAASPQGIIIFRWEKSYASQRL